MENKMLPTAEQFLLAMGCKRMNCDNEDCDFFEDVLPVDLIEFARMHVEKALKEASEGQIKRDLFMMCEHGESMDWKSSILNSYPLDNIK